MGPERYLLVPRNWELKIVSLRGNDTFFPIDERNYSSQEQTGVQDVMFGTAHRGHLNMF